MKKVVMTVVGVLALAATANAQIWVNEYGSWYDNRTEWERLVTNVGTADYNYVSSSPTAVEENGVTATKTGPGSLITSTYLTSTQNNIPITFTFSGNAFSGQFSTTVAGSIDFSIDGSLTNIYNLTPTVPQAASSKFLGYISKSSSDISVKLTPSAANKIRVQSFSFGQNTSSLGGNVAPEPGTLALALTGGCALLGLCVRRRRMSN